MIQVVLTVMTPVRNNNNTKISTVNQVVTVKVVMMIKTHLHWIQVKNRLETF